MKIASEDYVPSRYMYIRTCKLIGEAGVKTTRVLSMGPRARAP